MGHIIVDGVINGELAKTRFSDYLESLGESGSLEPVSYTHLTLPPIYSV